MRIILGFLLLTLTALDGIAQVILPYSQNNVCLDQAVHITPQSPLAHPCRNIIVKDFNGDNFDDVLVGDSLAQRVFLYVNNQNNTFSQVVVSQDTVKRFHSVDAGDMDGDGDLDVVVAYNDVIVIYNHTPPLTFSSGFSFNFDSFGLKKNRPIYMKVGKLNSDQFEDIALLAAHGNTPGLIAHAFRNTSTGQNVFNIIMDYSVTVMSPTMSLINYSAKDTIGLYIGNFDSDSQPTNEIIIVDKRDTNNVVVLKNLTSGPSTLTFQPKNVNTSSMVFSGTAKIGLSAISVADVNQDGFSDLVSLTRAFTAGNTLMGFAYFNGATSALNSYSLPSMLGTYQLLIVSATPTTQIFMPTDFRMGDINGDGYKDIVGINKNFLTIIMYNPAADPKTPYEASSMVNVGIPSININAEEMELGRLDNNGRIDIFYKSWRNTSGGRIGVIPNWSTRLNSAPFSATICPGATVALSAIPVPSILPAHTVDWRIAPSGSLIGSGNPFVVNKGAHYYPSLLFPFPGGSGGCGINIRFPNDTIRIKEKPVPQFSLTPNDGNVYVCPNQTTAITAITSGSFNYQYTWSFNGNALGTGPVFSSPPISGITDFVVKAFDPVTTCTAELGFTAYTHTLTNEPIIVSKSPICPGDSVFLYCPAAVEYTWSTGSHDTIIYVKPADSHTYDAIMTDDNGCLFSKTAFVIIDKECKLEIYNAVSVNGDSKNDKWIIDNIARYPKNSVKIFNRWGEMIYSEENYDNVKVVWPEDGKVPIPSTYFYLLDLKNGSEPIKGWIEVIKK